MKITQFRKSVYASQLLNSQQLNSIELLDQGQSLALNIYASFGVNELIWPIPVSWAVISIAVAG